MKKFLPIFIFCAFILLVHPSAIAQDDFSFPKYPANLTFPVFSPERIIEKEFDQIRDLLDIANETSEYLTEKKTIPPISTERHSQFREINQEQIEVTLYNTTYRVLQQDGAITSVTNQINGNSLSYDNNIAQQFNDSTGNLTFEYNNLGKLIKTIDTRVSPERIFEVTYAEKGNVSNILINSQLFYHYTYKSNGSLESIIYNGFTWKIDTNDKGEITALINPDYTSISAKYGNGEIVELRNERLNSQTREFTSDGLIYQSFDQGGLWTYTYLNGQVVSVTHENEDLFQINYDDIGRINTISQPNGINSAFSYGPFGLEKITNISGSDFNIYYQPSGAISSIEWGSAGQIQDSTSSIQFEYFIRWNTDQRITETTIGGTNTKYSYDPRGRIKEITQNNQTQQLIYDQFDRVIKILENNQEVEIVYINNGFKIIKNGALIRSVRLNFRGFPELISEANGNVLTFSYSNSGKILRRSTAPNVFSTFSYDEYDRLLSLSHQQSTTTLLKQSILYDSYGNVQSITDHLNEGLPQKSFNNIGQAYQMIGVIESFNTWGLIDLELNLPQLPTPLSWQTTDITLSSIITEDSLYSLSDALSKPLILVDDKGTITN